MCVRARAIAIKYDEFNDLFNVNIILLRRT